MPTPLHEPPGMVIGLILAAGSATRMGRAKQLLPVGDRPLLQHAIDAALAARSLASVIVVLGHAADEIAATLALPRRGVEVVVNPRHREGQSTSLAAGLAAAPPRALAAAVLLGDQPALGAARIDDVTTAFLTGSAPIVRPIHPDGTPGHPVLLGRDIWPAAFGLGGDEGARTLIARHPALVTLVRCRDLAPADVDTVQDYERVRLNPPH